MKKFWMIPAALLCIITLTLSGGDRASAAGDASRIADGIWLGDTDLGGMTLSEAAKAMSDYYKSLEDSVLTINIRGELPEEEPETDETPEETADQPGESTSESQAESQAEEKDEPADPAEQERPIIKSVTVPISTFGFQWSIEDSLKTASSLGQSGKLIERYKTLMDMKYAHAVLPLHFTVSNNSVLSYVVESFAPANDCKAKDASYSFRDGRLVVNEPDEMGITTDVGATVESILRVFDGGLTGELSCDAVTELVKPEFTAADIEKVCNRLATCTTTFDWTSNTNNINRGNNIEVAARTLNGTLAMPGEKISMNKVLGERTKANGYYPAGTFIGGQVIDAYGGGICQLASTVYQCLLYSELQVDVRYPHSMVVDYVPFAQDATLDWPGKDLVFTNNTSAPIYITSGVTRSGGNGIVTVSIYGLEEHPANRKVNYVTTVRFHNEYTATYELDRDHNAGEPIVSGNGHGEASAFCEKVVKVDGKEISRELVADDHYTSSRYHVKLQCNMLGLEIKYDDEGYEYVVDKNGNRLLTDKWGIPYYDGNGHYLLQKNCLVDAKGFAVLDHERPIVLQDEPYDDPTESSEDPGESTDDPGESTEDPGESSEDPGESPEDPGESTEDPGEPSSSAESTPEPTEPESSAPAESESSGETN